MNEPAPFKLLNNFKDEVAKERGKSSWVHITNHCGVDFKDEVENEVDFKRIKTMNETTMRLPEINDIQEAKEFMLQMINDFDQKKITKEQFILWVGFHTGAIMRITTDSRDRVLIDKFHEGHKQGWNQALHWAIKEAKVHSVAHRKEGDVFLVDIDSIKKGLKV